MFKDIRLNEYEKSSMGIVNIRVPKFSASLYHTIGLLVNIPVRNPLTKIKGSKESKNANIR